MNDLFASSAVKLTLTVLIIAAVVVIIWLLLRNIRLWYWKSDKIIDSMNDINSRVSDIENSMDSLRISTEKLIENSRSTNAMLMSLQENSRKLLELQNRINEETSEILRLKEAAETLQLEAGSTASETQKNLNEEESLLGQMQNMEKAVAELKRQKEQLEADINARIRD